MDGETLGSNGVLILDMAMRICLTSSALILLVSTVWPSRMGALLLVVLIVRFDCLNGLCMVLHAQYVA